jgi:NAD(P)H-hydrate epimerase
MQKVLTAAQMREVDRLTTERYGIPSIILMENAAHAVARVITEKLGGSVKGKSILILCGKGNNGGDGAALARLLALDGGWVEILLFGTVDDCTGDAKANFDICKSLAGVQPAIVDTAHPEIFRDSDLFPSGGSLNYYEITSRERFDELLYGELSQDWDCTVDAVIGTGLNRPLDGWVGNVVHHVNILNDTQRHAFGATRIVFSIDVPSGLDADLNEPIGINSTADVTVTFTAPKTANIVPTASRFGGELIVAEIGSPRELIDNAPSLLYLAEPQDAGTWLYKAEFGDASYKNKRGHAVLIAGSQDYSGAAVLAGNAAMRSGVGLVTLACPANAKAEIASRLLPEVILSTIESAEFGEHVSKADAIAVGCGLDANDAGVEEVVRKVVENRTVRVIVDAGALWYFNPLAENHPVGETPPPLLRKEGSPELPSLILTPHEGEFLRLLGTDDKDAIKDRVAAVRDFAVTHNVILVLKGERVLIGEPGGKVVVNPTGNSGLGKAGNGDTLTGILAGFVAQAVKMEIDVFETVVAAVYVAGMAGDVAEKRYGKRVMTASDVRECLVDVFESLEAVN